MTCTIHVAIQHLFNEMLSVTYNHCALWMVLLSLLQCCLLCHTQTFVFILRAAAFMNHSVYSLHLSK